MTHPITPDTNDGLDEILKMPLRGCDIQEWADAINQYMLDTFMELLDRIELSLKNHTTPEGHDLLTRSYIQNTLDFERKAIQEKFKPTVTPKTKKRNTDPEADVRVTVTEINPPPKNIEPLRIEGKP